MSVTVYDVARKAGVSIATVSRVFANSELVTEKSRRKVLSAAEKLGFRLNQSARRLAGSKSGLLGFVASQLRNPDYLEYFHTLESYARARGYEVLIADSELSYEFEWANIERMLKNQVEGLMIFPVSDILGEAPKMHRDRIKSLPVPCLMLGHFKGTNWPALTVDERQGAHALAEGLYERGWRNVIFVTGDHASNRPAFEREDEFHKTWSKIGNSASSFQTIKVPELNEVVRIDEKSVAEIIRALKSAPSNTALVTVNAEAVFRLYGQLYDAGISISKDIAVASFGCSPLATCFRPQVTLVEPNHLEIARAASETLFQALSGKPTSSKMQLVPSTISWRESTNSK
ncbi:MAG: hypothetical protein B9S32_10020 [Verrucomicrobia bacterium Tous-C9LFEB]|nr:MAG: hypothetical protein B9S32_10020 [Verrucomicrobia bacterium Tous-C9LFEB]